MVEQTSTSTQSPDDGEAVVGLLAEFPNPGMLLTAARSVRENGYTRFDTYSPFPVHGMDKAMGLKQSKLGYLVLIGGLSGAALGYWMQWWMGEVAYPLNIAGKPFFAFWSSVPIMFELTVLLSALATVAGILVFNRLPRPYNPLFNSERFAAASDDGFFLQIETSDKQFDREVTAEMLKQLGAIFIEPITDEEP